MTVLHQAASTELLNLLVNAGADVNMQGDMGWTALHQAAAGGHPEVLKLLVDAGADVNMVTGMGSTALYLAAQNGHTVVINLLVNAGADVNMQSGEGGTALRVAAQKGHTEVVKLLVDAGADVNMQNGEGWTALHVAAQKGHTEVVKLLVDAGADVNMQDGEGRTALHEAALGNLLMAQCLITEVRNACNYFTTCQAPPTMTTIAASYAYTLREGEATLYNYHRVSPCYWGYEHDCNAKWLLYQAPLYWIVVAFLVVLSAYNFVLVCILEAKVKSTIQ